MRVKPKETSECAYSMCTSIFEHSNENKFGVDVPTCAEPAIRCAHRAQNLVYLVGFMEMQACTLIRCLQSSGLSFYCSQKIHNLLEGVKQISADSDYVLFLDDDAQMSPDIMR
jgi:hypothetical protein